MVSVSQEQEVEGKVYGSFVISFMDWICVNIHFHILVMMCLHPFCHLVLSCQEGGIQAARDV